MDGGERRPNAGSHNPLKVASGRASAIRRAARKRIDSERSKAESGISESVTEELESSSVSEMIAASGSDVTLTESSESEIVIPDSREDSGERARLGKSSGIHILPEELPAPLHSGESLRKLRDSKDPLGYAPDLWQQMAELGWASIILPEQYGGLEFGFLGLGVVLEETGRTLTASPLFASAVVGASAILLGGETFFFESFI